MKTKVAKLFSLGLAAFMFSGNASAATTGDAVNAYSFTFKDQMGNPIKLADFKGKVLMVVNTASNCTLTSQYESMEELYEKYKKQGLVVIAVPANDFGNQEPGTDKEIKEFLANNFHITFPVTAKTHVNGNDIHPFYKWANSQVSILGNPKWNFHKYLIDRDGDLRYWFAPTTEPTAPKVTAAIEALLKTKPENS